jgi:hypothetical protein
MMKGIGDSPWVGVLEYRWQREARAVMEGDADDDDDDDATKGEI